MCEGVREDVCEVIGVCVGGTVEVLNTVEGLIVLG